MILYQIISNSFSSPKGANTHTEECQDQYLAGGRRSCLFLFFLSEDLIGE